MNLFDYYESISYFDFKYYNSALVSARRLINVTSYLIYSDPNTEANIFSFDILKFTWEKYWNYFLPYGSKILKATMFYANINFSFTEDPCWLELV